MSIIDAFNEREVARNTIRAKLVELGLATSEDKLTELATAMASVQNRGAVSESVKGGEVYVIPAGYHNGSGKVSGVTSGTPETWYLTYKNGDVVSKVVYVDTPTEGVQNTSLSTYQLDVTCDVGYGYHYIYVTVFENGRIQNKREDLSDGGTVSIPNVVCGSDIYLDGTMDEQTLTERVRLELPEADVISPLTDEGMEYAVLNQGGDTRYWWTILSSTTLADYLDGGQYCAGIILTV